jgi:hypothetical protein
MIKTSYENVDRFERFLAVRDELSGSVRGEPVEP